jgi:peptide/nickel transport system permease protein
MVIAYLVRRLLQAVVVVWLVTIITFILLKNLPGSPARAIVGQHPAPGVLEAVEKQLGLNRPMYVQYWKWFVKLLHGNLGFSYPLNQTVDSLIAQNLPKTLVLMGFALALAVLLAVPVGIVQATHRNRTIDHVFTAVSFIFYSMPAFFLGMLLIEVFSFQLHWVGPTAPGGDSVGAIMGDFKDMILPILTVALVTFAQFSRFMRSSVLDQITQDYVRTAKSKGASQRRILYRHVLRNSLIPIATLIGLYLPALFAGALITENVFNYPGMGLLFTRSATGGQDYSVVLGYTVLTGAATVVGSLLADLTYAALDPRVRLVSS